MRSSLHIFHNAMAVPRRDIPELNTEEFLQNILDAIDDGWRVSAYFGLPNAAFFQLYCLLSSKADGMLGMMVTRVTANTIPSLTLLCPQLHLFEREIAEQFGIVFENHPWLKPVRFQNPVVNHHDKDRQKPRKPGVMDFYQVDGEEVHEVAVGPVHAGIIEPGHFRFNCYGEQVLHLEISLGYQHRGVEQMLVGGPYPKTLYQMEAVVGDTTIGHTLAYTMIMEALSGAMVPARAHAIRGVALELERLANHTGDLGALAGDVGYLPTASYCGRIRGDFLNMTAELCGSRFGRGLLVPGGVNFDCSTAQVEGLLTRIYTARAELMSAVDLLWGTPSVMGRLENTGVVSEKIARDLGLVGPSARACGLNRDIRRDHPFGIYNMSQIPVVMAMTGDVYARTLVRWMEVGKSLDFIEEQLRHLPGIAFQSPVGSISADHVAIALTEGWRGEVCHVAVTDENGSFLRYKIIDPSFHNWSGVAMAMRGQQISDFPLCNKSFNLSYCGFDL